MKNRSVLIVDDSPFSKELLRQGLVKYGFKNIYEGKDGEEGVLLQSKHDPLITIMDVDMPIKDGRVALREILDLNKEAKVIMISEKNLKEEMISEGAVGFIRKPFQPAGLWTELDEALSSEPPCNNSEILTISEAEKVGNSEDEIFDMTSFDAEDVFDMVGPSAENQEVFNMSSFDKPEVDKDKDYKDLEEINKVSSLSDKEEISDLGTLEKDKSVDDVYTDNIKKAPIEKEAPTEDKPPLIVLTDEELTESIRDVQRKAREIDKIVAEPSIINPKKVSNNLRFQSETSKEDNFSNKKSIEISISPPRGEIYQLAKQNIEDRRKITNKVRSEEDLILNKSSPEGDDEEVEDSKSFNVFGSFKKAKEEILKTIKQI